MSLKDIPEVQDWLRVYTSVADDAKESKVHDNYGTWVIVYPGIGGRITVDIPHTNHSTNPQDVINMYEHAQSAHCIATGWMKDYVPKGCR
jgi:hypothetical protein